MDSGNCPKCKFDKVLSKINTNGILFLKKTKNNFLDKNLNYLNITRTESFFSEIPIYTWAKYDKILKVYKYGNPIPGYNFKI